MKQKKIVFKILRSIDKEFFWRAVARNGNTIADGSETYQRKRDVKKSLKNFMVAISAEDFEIEDLSGNQSGN